MQLNYCYIHCKCTINNANYQSCLAMTWVTCRQGLVLANSQMIHRWQHCHIHTLTDVYFPLALQVCLYIQCETVANMLLIWFHSTDFIWVRTGLSQILDFSLILPLLLYKIIYLIVFYKNLLILTPHKKDSNAVVHIFDLELLDIGFEYEKWFNFFCWDFV